MESSWLDLGTDVSVALNAPKAAPRPLEAPKPSEDGWLEIEDPNAGKTTLAFRKLIDSCMRGTDRVMACDGHYLAYRPYNREFDKETNPRTKERFQDFIAAGFYKHLGTYDEVQIYELLEGSPFRHAEPNYVIGKNYWADVRTCARAACARNWADYHDLMGACAVAVKHDRDPQFALVLWNDFVQHVGVTIQQMKGPTTAEVSAGFTRIRNQRGISKASNILLPPPETTAKKYSTREAAQAAIDKAAASVKTRGR